MVSVTAMILSRISELGMYKMRDNITFLWDPKYLIGPPYHNYIEIGEIIPNIFLAGWIVLWLALTSSRGGWASKNPKDDQGEKVTLSTWPEQRQEMARTEHGNSVPGDAFIAVRCPALAIVLRDLKGTIRWPFQISVQHGWPFFRSFRLMWFPRSSLCRRRGTTAPSEGGIIKMLWAH